MTIEVNHETRVVTVTSSDPADLDSWSMYYTYLASLPVHIDLETRLVGAPEGWQIATAKS